MTARNRISKMRRRGTGTVFRPSYKDKKTGELKLVETWSIGYYQSQRFVKEATGTKNKREAESLLRTRLKEIEDGHLTGRERAMTSFADLERIVVTDYINNGRDSLRRLRQSLVHLRAKHGHLNANEITTDSIESYKSARLEEGAARATINRELAALRRAFTLARKRGLAGEIPVFDKLKESAPRTGFFEQEQFEAVLRHLPSDLQPLAEALYITGWRVSELTSREWRHVDSKAGFLRLDPGETKNEEGRQFPLTPRLRSHLALKRTRFSWTRN